MKKLIEYRIQPKRRTRQSSNLNRPIFLIISTTVTVLCICGSFVSASAKPDKQNTAASSGLIVIRETINQDRDQLAALVKQVAKPKPGAQAGGNSPPEMSAIYANTIKANINFAVEDEEKASAPGVAPEVQAVYMKDAMDKLREAQGWTRTLAAIKFSKQQSSNVGKPVGEAVLQPNTTAYQNSDSALNQLIAWNRLGAWQGPSLIADGMKYDENKQIVTLSSGQQVNVSAIASAMLVDGAPAGTPVFQSVALPDGKVAYQLSPRAVQISHRVMQVEGKNENKVGGVALAVTVNVLSFSGLPALRSGGPESYIKHPVLISLSRLASEAQSYLHSPAGWASLPESLLYPGNVDRLYGFVLDNKHGDVFLVGNRASDPKNRIRLDTLIVGADSVWRRGTIPMVSLDMNPQDPGGPQTVRVIGIPLQSHFAKIMLDADYLMKRITFGALNVGEPGFSRINKLEVPEECRGSHFLNRFWLSPVPLAARDIHLSETGRTLLFATGVRVQTEALRAAGTTTVGTGEVSNFAEQEADLFTRDYSRFETSDLVQPEGIYVKLHGLVDIVTTFSLLREDGVKFQALAALATLPLPQLAQADSVPAFYPGISLTTGYCADNTPTVESGGVEMMDRHSMNSYDPYQDVTTVDLEHAADSFPAGQGVSLALQQTFLVPQASPVQGSESERLVSDGELLMAAGNFGAGRTKFQKATTLNPFMGPAWADLALADLGDGNRQSAWTEAQRALALDPVDPGIRRDVLEVEVFAEPAQDLANQWDTATRRAVSEDLVIKATVAYEHGVLERAREDATAALRVWPEMPSAYFIRSLSYDDLAGSAAEQDRAAAIKAYRTDLNQHPDANTRRQLADCLGVEAGLRMIRILAAVAVPTATTGQSLNDQIATVKQMANDILSLDPTVPAGALLKAEAMVVVNFENQIFGGSTDFRPAYRLAEATIRRFPSNAAGYAVLVQIYASTGKKNLALKASDHLVRLDPSNIMYQLGNVNVNALAGDCSKALSGIARLSKVNFATTYLGKFEELLVVAEQVRARTERDIQVLCH